MNDIWPHCIRTPTRPPPRRATKRLTRHALLHLRRVIWFVVFLMLLPGGLLWSADRTEVDCPDPPIVYPRLAQIAGVEGQVIAEIDGDSDGKASRVTLEGHQLLRMAVKQSLAKWDFKTKTNMSMTLTIKFVIEGTCLACGICDRSCTVSPSNPDAPVVVKIERNLASHR